MFMVNKRRREQKKLVLFRRQLIKRTALGGVPQTDAVHPRMPCPGAWHLEHRCLYRHERFVQAPFWNEKQ